MTGTATRTDIDVSHIGEATHWHLDPPLDGHDHIIIADRTGLAAIRHIDLPNLPDWVNDPAIVNRIQAAVEVYGADADGGTGDTMTALRQLMSLRRHTEGIDLADILTRLGYQEGM